MGQDEIYLGDGLYASHDEATIFLRAPREGGDHFVVLGPREFAALIDYVEGLVEASKAPAPTDVAES